ncbi:MAG: GNAT family N-acetyltransferase [Desulfobacteraceae bacterium]|nr:GNAT family N-acetyltransferase [Desulfobacteraceae bacterium]
MTLSIETERLRLREFKIQDKMNLIDILSDEDSMRFYPHPFSEKEVEGWIDWNLKNYAEYGFGLWAVILKKTDVFIGDCGITLQNIEGEKLPEIGYHIERKYCNQGYATEAALACKNYAFEVLGFLKVYTYTTPDNLSSRRVAEKIGMTPVKNFSKKGIQEVLYVAERVDCPQ